MKEKQSKTTIERVSAMIEEQALSKEQLMGYLRQTMEIRALENNISNLLGRAVLKGASHFGFRSRCCRCGWSFKGRRPDKYPSRTRACPCSWRLSSEDA